MAGVGNPRPHGMMMATILVFGDRFKIEKGTGATEKDIEAAFSKIDKDKSGSITKQVAAACHQQNSTLVFSGRRGWAVV